MPIVVAPPEGWPQTDGLVPTAALARALGQTVATALDLKDWNEGVALEDLLTRVQTAVDRSIRDEAKLQSSIRSNILDKLTAFPDAPAAAGVYPIPDSLLCSARRNTLLTGQVTGCEGVCTGHDSLTATVLGIGVCLVRYDGTLNSWRSTFLRHDYDAQNPDPIGHLRNVLTRRQSRSDRGADDPMAALDPIHTLLRRGFMAAAERRALLERTDTRWRMGGGVPAPMELLTGSGSMDLVDLALPLLDELLLKHDRWVFLPTTLSNRAWLTVANALKPGEVAIFQKGKPMLDAMIESATYAPGYRRKVDRFAAKLGEKTVVGAFRATGYAPPHVFVAHADRSVEAGVLAMADASLQPHRGTPLLLELARIGASVGLGSDAFRGIVEASYIRARASEMFQVGRVVNDRFA
jgi:hypothetical protein